MKNRNKLEKINVPELFYGQFLADLPSGTSTLVDKLHNTVPTKRGRGETRVIENLTHDEWEELYQHAAKAREVMKGANREIELRPAICARALADRMESLGVDNPVVYVPKRKTRAVQPQVHQPVQNDDSDDEDTSLNSNLDEELSLQTAEDESEVDNEELKTFLDDMTG